MRGISRVILCSSCRTAVISAVVQVVQVVQFLASQDPIEVMSVTEWVDVSIDFTDVTLVSDDTIEDFTDVILMTLMKVI